MPKLTYANVMSTIAVFIALGGTSYAVTKLPKGAVGERELKKNAVTGEKIKDATVTAADLAPGAAGSGPRGPRGADGAAGPQGPAGPGAGSAEAWRSLDFANPWTNYSAELEGGSFRKDQLGRVYLRGVIAYGGASDTIPGLNTRIATLPPGYRPRRGRIFIVQTGHNPYSPGRIDVNPDGSVLWLDGAKGEPDYTTLEGISFDVD